MGRAKRQDTVALIERAYSLEGTERDWLQGIVESAFPLLDRGLGTFGVVYAVSAAGLTRRTTASRGAGAALLRAARRLVPPPEIIDRPHRNALHTDTASGSSGLRARLIEHPGWRADAHPHGAFDAFSTSVAGDTWACQLSAFVPRIAAATLPLKDLWSRVAGHLGAGLRLRRALAHSHMLDGAEVVLSASGRVGHAGGAAAGSPDARDRLRQGARDIERTGGAPGETEGDQAVELWRGLVSGRWSLIDHFERSGRRYLIARRNDPAVSDPRALSLRERQVAWYAALGHSNKLVAGGFGLSLSTVATHLARVVTKLGVGSRAQLIQLLRGPGARALAPRRKGEA